MDCKAFRRESEELESGNKLTAAAQAHVDACVSCRTFHAERLSLRQLVGSLKPVTAPPDFDFRLRARLAATRSAGNGSLRRTRFAPSLRAITVAASFAVLIAAAIVFQQSQSTAVNALAGAFNPSLAKGNAEGSQSANDVAPQSNAATMAAVAPPNVNHSVIPSESDDSTGERITSTTTARKMNAAKHNRAAILDNDLSVQGQPTVVTPAQPSPVNAGGEATALLRVSSQPIKLHLHDPQGVMRSVSLEPVIFGAQDFLERTAQGARQTNSDEGIW